jgi:RNA polymerase sigma-70 factor (ECF subfamily)
VTNTELIQRWQQGDINAFEELYTHHAQTIYRLGWSMLGEGHAAEDVVQETFLRAYKARWRFDPNRASFGTWLYQIALNYCRSYLRRKRLPTIPWIGKANNILNQPDLKSDPETHLLRTEYQRALWEAVQMLTPRLREVITLHYYLDLPAVEIAVMLSCPEGTIYSRLHNARRRLAEILTQKGITTAEMIEVKNVS